MKRKSIATSRSELADILNKIDGLRTGVSQKQARQVLKYMEILETALIVAGYKSAVLIIRKKAKQKALKLKKGK